MTLLRQLVIAITFLFTCLLAGNLIVSVTNARTYFYEQMQVHAEDTATSLGFTLSQAVQDRDIAQLNSMVDVIFDRGYYRRISYQNLSGEVVVERRRPINIEGVPAWFIDYIDLPAPMGRAEVISGWYRLGELSVEGHPGYAYQDLWRVFREQLSLFVITALLSYGLAGIGLNILLRPLRRVEEQAEAICRREFPLQDNLPRTRELRRMVVAMNRMVQKIKDMFQEQVELTESLHRQAHLDPVTGLSNRRDFDARFEAFIKSELGGSAGLMLLIQVDNMQAFNGQYDRDTGDQCLCDIAAVLRRLTAGVSKAILSRRAGADFCVFLPSIQQEEVREWGEKIFTALQSLSWFSCADSNRLHMGVAHSSMVMLDNQLLSQADTALRQAQHGGASAWQLYQPPHPQQEGARALQAGEWKTLLQTAIAARTLLFYYQPVVARDGSHTCVEVLSRLSEGEQLYPAGVFLPMAERFNLGVDVDRMNLEMLYDAHAGTEVRLCVNLSSRSIQQRAFVEWLERFLALRSTFARRLIFELPEQALVVAEAAVRRLALVLRGCGADLALDHFGTGASAFSYMQSIPLRMLKIDRCFIQSIDSNPDNQFFVKSLVQIAHSCDVMIIAEGVETEAEWQTLLGLGVDGGQGYFLGGPGEAING